MANPKHKTQRPNANPDTLVPAKLKMMPNGTVKVAGQRLGLTDGGKRYTITEA